jgi:DNA-binding transcriptional ArsR family regulator
LPTRACRGDPNPLELAKVRAGIGTLPTTRAVVGIRVGRDACILNHMVQHSATHFNASFAALADATRRGVLDQLARGDASITDLADKFEMTLTGMKKHVGVLEVAGLVTTEKVGRVRYCRLGSHRLDEVSAWIDTYHQLWDARFSELDKVLEALQRKEETDGHEQD